MRQKDLTKGPVFRTISLFALPMLIGNLLQQMYNVVDTWVVGKYIGSDALAGVGSAYTLMVFLTSIILGLCMGSGVVFSLYFGRKDEKKLEEAAATSLTYCALASLILWFQAKNLMCIFYRRFLRLESWESGGRFRSDGFSRIRLVLYIC